MRTPAATFDPIRFEHAAEVLCACCQCILERHQPDTERPDRLLGTCPDCGAWFLIDDDARVMLALPDVRALRDA
jgi:hypothetical protein